MDKQYARAAHYLEGFDEKSAAEFTSDPDNAASLALMQAAISAGTGDRVHAMDSLRLPLKVYSRPDSDRFYQRWTADLNRSLSAAQ